MPMTPQVRTPPRPWVEKQEPNTDSILSSRIMQDSSRHRLDMAAGAERGQAGPGGCESWGRRWCLGCHRVAWTVCNYLDSLPAHAAQECWW